MLVQREVVSPSHLEEKTFLLLKLIYTGAKRFDRDEKRAGQSQSQSVAKKLL